MAKRNLKKMAILGMASGLAIAGEIAHGADEPKDQKENPSKDDPSYGNMGYHLYTEEELMLELNEEGRKLYNELSPEGKQLALKVASAMCNGTNECKGLNACQTEKNACAGQGSCKGTGKCAISDKNLAVKLVHDKLVKKREKLQGSYRKNK